MSSSKKQQQSPSSTGKGGGAEAPTLLDKLGGAETMLAVMDDFYGRVLEDPELSRFFETVDVVTLKRHSLNIIATAFSPDSNSTSSNTDSTAAAAATSSTPLIQDIPSYLTRTHKRLFEKQGHTEKHFDLFVGHFLDTLEANGVEEETRNEAKEKLFKFRIVFEEGAKNAAAKQKRKRESKVRFESETKPGTTASSWTSSVQRHAQDFVNGVTQDPFKAAGVFAAVVGAIAIASLVVLNRKKRS